jgi:hypothetical protein
MSYSELLESIRELPIADQIALAETILEKVGHAPSHPAGKSVEERDLIRRQMREAAQDALDYYRNDPDVALWQNLGGEPFHEYDAGSDLAGKSIANGGSGDC